MSGLTTDILLDALRLLVQARDDEIIEYVNELIECHNTDKAYNVNQDNGLSKKFIQLLTSLKNINSTPEGKQEQAKAIVSFLTDPIIRDDKVFYNALKEALTPPENGEENNSFKLKDIKQKVLNDLNRRKYYQQVRSMWNKLNACQSSADSEQQEIYLTDVVNYARQILDTSSKSARTSRGAAERIDFSDSKSMQTGLQTFKERDLVGSLKTGLAGFNKMCGKRGALALGESVCIYALLHNFKSGLLMTIARGILRFNRPPAHLPGKPLILFISLENEANKNLYWFWKVAYETITGKSSDGMDEAYIIKFVQEVYLKEGWHFIIERWAGNKFGYDEFEALMESYKSEGYSIAAVFIDYANKMKKTSRFVSTTRDDLLITALFEHLCTYCKTNGILFITAHQLNREVMKKIGDSTQANYVKSFTAAGAAGSIGASQEIDLEIFIHLETNHRGRKFLTMQRGKHRYVDDTPEKNKYCAYAFTEAGIGDDIELEVPNYVTDIYADTDDPQSPSVMDAINDLL